MTPEHTSPEDAADNRQKPPEEFEYIGQSVDRVEDPRLLTGHGDFVDDIDLPNMAHVAVLASPHAHARILDIDTSEAEALEDVAVVLTGQDAVERTSPLPSFAQPPVEQWCLAVDRVRHVGEYVAAVVAENRYIAEDAVELIDVEYETLPVMSDPMESMDAQGDAVLHPDRNVDYDGNVALYQDYTFGEVEDDFEAADVVVSRQVRWPRSGGQPMETAGAVAEYNEGTGEITIRANTSQYNWNGWALADSLNVPSHKLNVVPTDAGGSFGTKLFLHKICVLTGMLARASGRPVKFLEDRIENMTSCDSHGSERYYELDLALTSEGKMLSLDIDTVDDYGAYFQYEVGHHGNSMAQVVGPYTIDSVSYAVTAVLTNKCQQGAYRGFGSEVHTFALERLVDAAADELGMSPVQLRRKNLIPPDSFPYRIPGGNIYDSGNYEAVLETALDLSNYEAWRDLQAAARDEGRYIGIGPVTCQERSVFSATEFWFWNDDPDFRMTSSPESVGISVDRAGNVHVSLHSPFWGNSPETVATQIVAEELTVEPDDISVNYADMQTGLDSTGPGGSRYTVMIAGAIERATAELKAKMRTIAADELEAAEADLEFADGDVRVRGAPDRSRSVEDIALAAHAFALELPEGVNSGLAAEYTYDHPYTTMPEDDRSDLGVFYPIMGHMVHIPVVEVDPETGQVDFLDYTAVHDCGTVVNPKTLAGHVRGGTAQGIASALYEEFVYDENGQLVTANFTDYLVPRVTDVPDEITVGHVETPSPFTEYGIKGGGEGGRMAAPAAVAAAVEDALAPLDVRIDDLPMTPESLATKIRSAREE